MVIDSIDFNQQWAAGVTEKQFIDQYINAFDDSDHPIAKMTVTKKKEFLKQAFFLCQPPNKAGSDKLPAISNDGISEPTDTEV